MLQLKNNTPFAASMAVMPNEAAIDTLYLVVKATFNIGKQWTLVDKQLPPTEVDDYWTDDENSSSIKYASDFHTGKSCSDIIMLGHAYVANNQQASQLDVALRVSKVQKTIRVFGERQWQNGHIGPAKPFKTMAMVYENAYGGVYTIDGKIVDSEMRNPVGRGFSGQRNTAEMNGILLPNLEDPDNLIREFNQRPTPACFGASAASWLPRMNHAGTFDDAWQNTRSPYLPEDFDSRFFNVAHPDLLYPGFLKGGETVEITNMHPRGNLKFEIPHVKLNADVSLAEKQVSPLFNFETLLIEPNQLKLSMIWRAAIQCDKQAQQIGNIKIKIAR